MESKIKNHGEAWLTKLFNKQAGASAHDALRSIVISEQLLGTQEIVLVKHTGCGMLTFTNEDAYSLVDKNLGYINSLVDSKTSLLTNMQT